MEVFTFAFFFCMMVGSICEIVWMEDPSFYPNPGALYIFFIGFIALAFLSIGIERSAKFKTKGLIALVPLTMAIATLYIGMDALSVPYYFIALIVGVIPALFLYQGYISEGIIRRQFFFIGFGYFLIFLGEALNYYIVQTNFPWLEESWASLTGLSFEFFPPLIILFGLLLLFNGYVRLTKKLTF